MSNDAVKQLTLLYQKMVKDFPGGVSNTSTAKFDEIRHFLSERLELSLDDIYIVGADKRTTNLPIRLTQGGQAMKRTELGVAVFTVGGGKDVDKAVGSASTSIRNYLAERGRGNYNAILLVAVDSTNSSLHAKRLIQLRDFKASDKILELFPGIEVAVSESASNDTNRVDRNADTPEPRDMSTFDELLIKALAAKQFLIVAGGTGTGKTRAARQVARSVAGQSRVEVVAVGADWTDNRPLLGFRNLLAEDGNIYSAPPALRMIIKAISDPSKPHFLILDEMNLSHVERYFADFLSSMESGEKIKLHDSKADLTTEDDLLIPGQLEWPKNLFVIGTVNIDETTYMFSPKVLDRAHVVEFKVSWQAISDGLNALPNAELEPMSESDVEEFMNISLDSGKKLEAEDHVKLNAALEKLFDAMNGSRFLFAHRTARDCLNYVAASKALETSGIVPEQPIEVLIDRAILQKALPKINGSSGALTVTLNKLVAVTNELGLGLSSDKLSSMSRQLKSDQFVSFIQ